MSSAKKVKPKLIDFYRDKKRAKGIDFVAYAWALEEYIIHLEKEIKKIVGRGKSEIQTEA